MSRNKRDFEKRDSQCNTCTIRLVRISYERARWFRLIREPLRLGMVVMGKLYGIDPGSYPVKNENCRGCIRFTKLGLNRRSRLFRLVNNHINPGFDRILERLLTEEEITEAKSYARESSHLV